MTSIQELLNIPDGIIESREEEAVLGLLRTVEMLLQHARRTLFSDGLSQSQFNILLILEHEGGQGMSQKAIGERLVTTKGNTSQHIAHLESMGMIKRKAAKQDRRRNLIKLSAKGQRTVNDIEPRYREQVASVFRSMSSRELGTLIQGVDKLRNNLLVARRQWEAEA